MRTSLIRKSSLVALAAVLSLSFFIPQGARAGGGSSWQRARNPRCFKPLHRNHTVRMHCLALFKLTKDGNPKRDYYTLRHWGTARSKDGYAMKVFRLRVYPHEDGPRILSWTQFSPAEDQNRDRCDQISIGISYVASISWTHSICEEWDIRPAFNRPGKFGNTWKPISGQPVIESERQVAYAIAVNVKQGKSPRWHLRSYADVYD